MRNENRISVDFHLRSMVSERIMFDTCMIHVAMLTWSYDITLFLTKVFEFKFFKMLRFKKKLRVSLSTMTKHWCVIIHNIKV